MTNKIFDAALRYAAQGLAVIPLQPGGKKPLSRHGSKDASKDADQIKKWWADEPRANVGIVTGSISGIVGIDVDEKDGRPGHKSLQELFKGQDITTLSVQTPTGGLHLYFRIPPDLKITNRADMLPGIDVRGEGGYLVAPPSLIGDKAYRWTGKGEFKDLPPEIIKKIRERRAISDTELQDEEIPEGRRNQALASIAGALRRKGVSREAITTLLRLENERRCKPPLPENEIQQIVGSIMRYDPQTDDHLRQTDSGNAARFVEEHGSNARYVAEFGRWYTWDETRWRMDIGSAIMGMAQKTVQSIYQDALQQPDPEKRQALIKFAKASANSGKIDSMLKIARAHPRILITQDKLDRDPWLLGIENGVMDLRSGSLCEARREDMVTQGARVSFDPTAKCERWEAFLDRIFENNAPIIEFVQRAVGYTLTGHSSEQVMFFAYGEGANGKSTMFSVLSAMMGDYGRSISPEMLMERPQGAATNDLARLRGARLVTTIEVEQGKRMAEALVKAITGGDRITARFLFAEFFEFDPTFKIWLAANHKPVIRGTDYAIWRRIMLIPFNVKIPEAERDPKLKDKLLAELPGIFNWALEGCLAWQRYGLVPPPEVLSVTDQYRAEMDVLGQWLLECCVFGDDKEAGASELYASFRKWAQDNGEWVMPQSKFKLKMEERGYHHTRTKRGNVYRGIGIMTRAYERDLTREI